LIAARVDLPRVAATVIDVHDGATAEFFADLLHRAPLAAVAVRTFSRCTRPPSELRSGQAWRDVRSLQPVAAGIAAWTTSDDVSRAPDAALRGVFDLRAPAVAAGLAEILRLRVPFVFHDAKHDLFNLWSLGIDTDLPSIYDTWVVGACLHLGEYHKRLRTPTSADPATQIGADLDARADRENTLSLAGQCAEFGVACAYASYGINAESNELPHLADGALLGDRHVDRAAADAESVLRLFAAQQPAIVRRGLQHHLETVEFPFVVANARIEWNGVHVDAERLDLLREATSNAANHFAAKLQSAGVNPPGSADSFLAVMRRAGLAEHFETGAGLSDSRLRLLESLSPTIRAFRLHRRYSRLASEEWLSGTLAGADGRVHPIHTQLGAATGRNTCSAPNLAGIGRVLRPVVTAPHGRAIVEFDYAQIEVGVAAAEHDDPDLIAAYNSGDVYVVMAQRFYAGELTDREKTLSTTDFRCARPDLREAMKTFVLSVFYNVQAPTLAVRFGISIAKAESERQRFLDLYPALRRRLEQSVAFGMARGYATIVSGLRRGADRRATARSWVRNYLRNTPIQGSAAVVFKRAVVLLDREFRGTDTKLILPVHDAIVIECDRGGLDHVAERAATLLRHALRSAYPRLQPKVSANRADPSCWNKDGHSESLREFLSDPDLDLDAPQRDRTAARVELPQAGAPNSAESTVTGSMAFLDGEEAGVLFEQLVGIHARDQSALVWPIDFDAQHDEIHGEGCGV
jgi:DNA polymerase I-like protein with 3'-5' exonuclease and polymerase domains